MRRVLQAFDIVARLGMAAGLLLIGFEMHRANEPAADPAVADARYLQTAEREDAPKRPATLSDIDRDLRQINVTLAGVAVNVLERH